MAGQAYSNMDELYTSFSIEVEGNNDNNFQDLTPIEITLGESLHTPGLQTSVKVQSYLHSVPSKNFDQLRGRNITINAVKPALEAYGIKTDFLTTQTIYRVDGRKLFNNNTEEFNIRACDITLLNDAEARVSKSWKCTTPSSIVDYVLRTCAGARSTEVETTSNARDYIAENIHPFQVINQQANYALGSDLDPSFLHFMTYENNATHHFKSLSSMTKQASMMKYSYSETGVISGFGNPFTVMTYNFPCDFDLLSDILNGVDQNGRNISSLILLNPLNKTFSLLGENQVTGCGIGSSTIMDAISNMNSYQQQDMCQDWTSIYLLKRKARMSLLEKDKIALRLVVPWNPNLHAGKMITFNLYNKETNGLNYGSGDYLIVNLVHTIKYGGYAITTMDCVSRTTGRGEV